MFASIISHPMRHTGSSRGEVYASELIGLELFELARSAGYQLAVVWIGLKIRSCWINLV